MPKGEGRVGNKTGSDDGASYLDDGGDSGGGGGRRAKWLEGKDDGLLKAKEGRWRISNSRFGDAMLVRIPIPAVPSQFCFHEVYLSSSAAQSDFKVNLILSFVLRS